MQGGMSLVVSALLCPGGRGWWEELTRELGEAWGKGAIGGGGLAAKKEILGRENRRVQPAHLLTSALRCAI